MKVAEDSYEYIITNLPYSFDLEDLKICYHWRWQMEVAFRYLKHANGLLYFHSKKPEYLKQEIYANLILYNFGVFLANETSVYKGYKQDKIEMRGDRAEMSDFPLYLNTVAGGLDRRDQTIGGFSFVVKIYAVPVVEIIG